MDIKTIAIPSLLGMGALYYLFGRKKTSAEKPVEGVSGAMQVMPYFVGGGGGQVTSSAPVQQDVLGGNYWAPADVDTGESDQVQIAKIQAGVQQANITANQNILQSLLPILAGGGSQEVIDAPRPVFKGDVSISDASNYLKEMAQGGIDDAKAFSIYDNAVKHGFNKFDVAEAFGRAGITVSPQQVQSFTDKYNLKSL